MSVVVVIAVLAALAGAAGAAGVVAVTRPGGRRDGGGRAHLLHGELRAMGAELARVTHVVQALERERSRQHGELAAELRATATHTASLSTTAAALREVLASPKARGQWGERMADDVLRLAGLVEGVSYERQRATPSGTVPDFTFFLPHGRLLHMDAKFPIDNYVRCLEATSDHEQADRCAAFLRDVRARVKELTGRGYVDPQAGTVDYVLLFIPNESVYAFVHEHDPRLIDVALSSRVVLCSPLTLFAVLAVVRQAVDAVTLARTSDEILSALGAFASQWDRFCGSLDKLGRSLEALERAYGEVAGTRRRALERPLARVEALRRERGLAPDPDADRLHVVDMRAAADLGS